MKLFLYILIFILSSCNLPDNETEYQEGLVVFGRIELKEINGQAKGIIDNVKVSLSSTIDANLDNSNELYVNSADVFISGPFDESDENIIDSLYFDSLNDLGEYTISTDLYKIWPNRDYTLNVKFEDYEVMATTTTPSYLTIESIEDTYNCEECSDSSIYGETTCENAGENWISQQQNIDIINVDNYDSIYNSLIIFPEFDSLYNIYGDLVWGLDPEILDYFQDQISEIELSRFGCAVGSFASKPYFVLNIDNQETQINNNPSAIRIISYALEPDKMDLEPLNDDGTFFDYNLSNERDSTLINTFYDTTAVFNIWKGPYFRDENYNPYLLNPFIWTVETSPSPIMWLYFNYYGKHLIVVQSSDQAYYDYLSGDPLGQNQYIIPDSNIEGGYGLFTSNYSKAFFLNIMKKD
tara:strand:- start:2509 stop:3738 length:1230 start_codon:yes stop_codon:yes gene_type:complete